MIAPCLCRNLTVVVSSHTAALASYVIPASVLIPIPQKSNHAEVNEAINGLLIEEEDFEGLKHSITTYDNFDQVRGRRRALGRRGVGRSPCTSALQRQNANWVTRAAAVAGRFLGLYAGPSPPFPLVGPVAGPFVFCVPSPKPST